jgi:hypothetical protein
MAAEIAKDERTRPLFKAWDALLQLSSKARAFSEADRTYRKLTRDLTKAVRLYDDDGRPREEHRALIDAGEAIGKADKELHDTLMRKLLSVAPSPTTFIRERLRAPQYAQLLSGCLLDEFTRAICARNGVDLPPPPERFRIAVAAPRLSKIFATSGSETCASALVRLDRWYLETRREIMAPMQAEKGGGREPKEDMGYLSRWGQWLYRLDIQGPPRAKPYGLARELHAEKQKERGHTKPLRDCGCPAAVQDGIEAARRLLAVWLPEHDAGE